MRWDIVEQPNYVHRAATLPLPPGIAFFDTIEAAVEDCAPNVVVASGVLQYVAEPLQVLERLVAIGPGTLIVDRMPCIEEERDAISVQRVAPAIYPASFPTWLFASERIPGVVNHAYRELARFDSGDRLIFEGRTIEHRGWIFERRD
jgi:putative methyltransferase (TIGR04325 family)